ncbi:gamma-glutamyl kinase [Roseibacterium sp. SDUM158017]|uniref:gamma-glutamyl kinase n=1 Tax=Roseicyclus salinarum TaxID=3036773 RepID=UPI002414E7A1|nr:gamma-glutamyl kinase [Roseibacterium sp. SDUM158017]MDG4648753.1 gamma-glutamyl kinase [Roseibacterium sp. SDUM158017]
MLVFWKARLVLLAVPKTGTTALEAAFLPHADASILHPPGLKHCNLRRWRRQLARIFENDGARPLEVMAVMREPVGWLSSWHRYRGRPAISGRPQSTEGIGFEDFVAAWLQDQPAEFARIGRQSRFLSDEGGRPGADHLFRHDRLEEAVAFLENRLSVSVSLERRNVSPAGPEPHLPQELDARLRREAAADFALWDDLCAGRYARVSEAAAPPSP